MNDMSEADEATGTQLIHLGLSADRRTNRWAIVCPACVRRFEPTTTMLAVRVEQCPRCTRESLVDYNQQTLKLLSEES